MLKWARPDSDLEMQAQEALCELLACVPIIDIEGMAPAPRLADWRPDFLCNLRVAGSATGLACEVKSSGQPRYVRTALLELLDYAAQAVPQTIPVLIAPYLSPAAQAMCRERSVGYLDLEGNAWIVFGGVFIERSVSARPAAERREIKSIFKPKSAQILRVMLRDPRRAWRVVDLAVAAGVSVGHVSNVRTSLLEREWARASDEGVFLSEPDALLDAWRDVYASPPGERKCFYTTLHGSAFEEAVRGVLCAQDGLACVVFASISAAHWLAPYSRSGTQYFYADHDGLNKLTEALKLSPVTRGENVVVTLPKDEGVFGDTVEASPGIVCTSSVQTYLDLSVMGERAAEAAEHLRREALIWPG